MGSCVFCAVLPVGFLCMARFVYHDSGKRESISVPMPAAESRDGAEPGLCVFSEGLDVVSSKCTGATARGRRANRPGLPLGLSVRGQVSHRASGRL